MPVEAGGDVRVKDVATITHPGMKRTVNEDAVIRLDDVPAFAVADGMGGAGAGDVAAAAAIAVLEERGRRLHDVASRVARDRSSGSRLQLGQELEELFHEAHLDVEREAEERDRAGMATTLVAAVVAGEYAYIAHVGDSRAYLWRDGKLRLLTDDHTLAMLRLRQGRMTEEEYRTSPLRQRLYQALGAGEIDVDTLEVTLADDDVLVLCSDGISDVIDDATVARSMQAPSLAAAAQSLVDAANAAGGDDNIAVALVRVGAEQDFHDADEIARVLGSVFIFKGFSGAELSVVAPYLDQLPLRRGEILFREGEAADHFFVVVQGRLRISRGETHLVDVPTGGHVGELCLARPTLRSATAVSLDDALVFALARDRFQEILQRRPNLGARMSMALLDTVGDRLRDLTERIATVERVATGELQVQGLDLRQAVLQATKGKLSR